MPNARKVIFMLIQRAWKRPSETSCRPRKFCFTPTLPGVCMKKLVSRYSLLCGPFVVFAGFALAAIPMRADTITYSYTGGAQSFTAPRAGVYDILAYGASGGLGINTTGGLGAEIGGDFTLSTGEVLTVDIGNGGSVGGAANAGDGGGGTFVVAPGGTPLVVAGGGGGGGFQGTSGRAGARKHRAPAEIPVARAAPTAAAVAAAPGPSTAAGAVVLDSAAQAVRGLPTAAAAGATTLRVSQVEKGS